MTGTDYPAAHSMDTSWHAVDAAGHVAVFDSGEDGHVPEGAEQGVYFLCNLFGARFWDDALALVPDAALAEGYGFFLYDFAGSDYPMGLYERHVVPERPIHVDQLPPTIRNRCKRFRIPIAFAQAERLQPLDYFACQFWDEDRADAYLAADGMTVRPRRGREGQFPAFVRWLREQWPDRASRYRFEGVDDGP